MIAKLAKWLLYGLLAIGGVIIVNTAISAHSYSRLLSYDYMSFVDSLDNGAANDFYTAIGLCLVGSTSLGHFWKNRTMRIVSSSLFVFISVSLVYALLHLRIGVRPF